MRIQTAPFLCLLFLAPLLILLSCDNKDTTAEEEFRSQVAKESNNTLSVDSFEKTNGYDKVVQGISFFVIEWTAVVSTNRSLWKISVNKFNPFYWSNFQTSLEKPQPLGTFRLPYQTFGTGAKIRLKGSILVQKTDNGWRAGGLTVESSHVISGLLQDDE